MKAPRNFSHKGFVERRLRFRSAKFHKVPRNSTPDTQKSLRPKLSICCIGEYTTLNFFSPVNIHRNLMPLLAPRSKGRSYGTCAQANGRRRHFAKLTRGTLRRMTIMKPASVRICAHLCA